ncbi:MAG: sodium:solute symporter family protein [Flammeovirgaceae bacterium]
MALATIDWVVIIGFLLLIVGVGLSYTNKAGKNIESFFLGGRNLPWWIAGTSMVATTFAADTPLLITELVANDGISGNWLWWNGLIGGILTTFFFAKLWRRANIVTDVEFIELRYAGKPAAFLRGFKSIYLGVFLNSVIIAWVNLALMALIEVFFDIPKGEQLQYVAIAMIVVALYSSLSGLLGVAITDFIQFIIAMAGCIVLAVIVVNSEKIGGISGLQEKLPADVFNFFPQLSFFGAASVAETTTVYTVGFASFFAFVGMQWWASWYPGADPGGGGYVAQRIMSAKNEEEATKATLLFQIAHHALRPWPWIIVALCAIVLYPELSTDDKKLGYVLAMKEFLPDGLKGLLLVAFFAAYMSTISTQLNWGTSYLINDFYNRFIEPEADQKRLVLASRIGTVVIMIIGLAVTSQISTLENAFKFMINCGAGLGMVLILRWYWWRINAWSEIAATLAPFIPFSIITYYNATLLDPKEAIVFPYGFFITVAFTTVVWLIVTFVTSPTETSVLNKFYQKIQPEGAWGVVRSRLGIPKKPSELPSLFLKWFAGIALVYAFLFFMGKIIFGDYVNALYYLAVFGVSAFYLSKKL